MSLYTRMLDFSDLLTERGFSVANQRHNLAHKQGLEHRSFNYYGKIGGNGPITHKLVLKGGDADKEVGTFEPVNDKDKKDYDKRSTQPKQKITPGKERQPVQGAERQQQLSRAQQVMQANPQGKVREVDQPALRQADADRVNGVQKKTKLSATVNATARKQQMKDENAKTAAENKLLKKAGQPLKPMPFSKDELKEAGGLGTAKSQAGECAVVGCLQFLRNQYSKSSKKNPMQLQEEAFAAVDNYFAELEKERTSKVGTSGEMVLTKDWIISAWAQARTILGEYGVSDIAEVVWDTPEGRHLVGSNGHGTSADMFLRMKDGRRVGLSLKKTGKVAIANRGMNTMIDDLIPRFQASGMAGKDIVRFRNEFSSDGQYKKDLDIAMQAAQRHTLRDRKYNEVMKKTIAQLQKNPVDNISNYLTSDNENALFKEDPTTWTGDQKKVFARLHEYLATHSSDKTIRNQAAELKLAIYSPRDKMNERLFNFLTTNTSVDHGMKDFILENSHIYEMLGLDMNGNLNTLVGVYGDDKDPDGGVAMNAQRLVEFFSVDEPKFAKYVETARKGDQRALQKVKDLMIERVTLDYSSGKKGFIQYNRRNPTPPPKILSYPLFNMEITVRGIGAAPSFIINQENGLTNALKYGTDIDKWPEKTRKKYYSEHYISLLERLADNPSKKHAEAIRAEMGLVQGKFDYKPAWEKKELDKIAVKRASDEED